jgi:hypothetical protein
LFQDSAEVIIPQFLWEKVHHDSKEFHPFVNARVLSFSTGDFSYIIQSKI